MALATLTLLLALPFGQVQLAEGQVGVITSAGMYLVDEGPPADTFPLLTAADFGHAELQAPSITHITGTDSFIVTTRNGFDTGGLWRVDAGNILAPTVTDLTPAISLSPLPDLTDGDYLRGLDQLYLTDQAGGRILVLPDPANASGADLAEWVDMDIEGPRSISVHATEVPFGIIVAGRFEVHRYDAAGNKTVLIPQTSGVWHQVEANTRTGEYYVLNENSNGFGKLANGFPIATLLNFNASGFCSSPVQEPVDIDWDPFKRRPVVLAADGVLPCLFSGAATGPNHIVRMTTAQGGPPSNVPVLLTPPGNSGIAGEKGDLALVRSNAGEVAFFGSGGTTGAGGHPMQFNDSGEGGTARIGENVIFSVQSAPPNATALLVLGATLQDLSFQGQTIYPAISMILETASNADGEVTFAAGIANDLSLVGITFFAQWWFPDTTTPVAGDVVGTQGAVFNVGEK